MGRVTSSMINDSVTLILDAASPWSLCSRPMPSATAR